MGIFGSQNGRIFRIVSSFVDRKQIPAASAIPAPSFLDWVKAAPYVLTHTSNGIWLLIALAVYFAFPYDLSETSVEASGPVTWEFFTKRFQLWLLVTHSYTLFWHVTLYFLHWAERPFIANRAYNADKVLHNIFWSTSGIAIWTVFENVFAFLWATQRLPYLSDAAAFASWGGIANFVAAAMLVPVWRDAHFFASHRLLHFKPLYAQVHSLHHRNTDIEPFAGLSMHPIEHLYYYACILPSLVFYTTPFAFLWNGMHLLLSPAGGHSGWEDHLQASAFHYMHHRYFECNYAGTNAAWLDVVFGTFTERLNEVDRKEGPKPRADAKSTLRAPPTVEFVTYLTLAMGCLVAWGYAAVGVNQGTLTLPSWAPMALAALAGYGPVALAYLVTAMGRSGGVSGAGGKSLASTAVLLALGTVGCAVPVYMACYKALVPPEVAVSPWLKV